MLIYVALQLLSAVTCMINIYGSDGTLTLLAYENQLALLEKQVPPQKRNKNAITDDCSGQLIGTFNSEVMCWLNGTLQLVYVMCCDTGVWNYIQKVNLHPNHRLKKLRTVVLDFIEHYHEPRVQCDAIKKTCMPQVGQKWVDAVAEELNKLDPNRFDIVAGGNDYLALLYMIESLVGGSINLNFSLKSAKLFTPPVGILLSTFWLKYSPQQKEQESDEAFNERYQELFVDKIIASMPESTWLERLLAYQARQEDIHVMASAWPKFLWIAAYQITAHAKQATSFQEPTKEEFEAYDTKAFYASFPLRFDMHTLGLSDTSVIYTCRGFALSTLIHLTAVVLHNGRWVWCNDAIISSGKDIDAMVEEVSREGSILIKNYKNTGKDSMFSAQTLYLYERTS